MNVARRFISTLKKIARPTVRMTRRITGAGLRRASFWLEQLGISPGKIKRRSHGMVRYTRNLIEFRKMLGRSKEWPIGDYYPILDEWHEDSGTASGDYFHQDIWAARKIFERNPARHIDVGSRIDGFVAHVACFREIEVYDIRPIWHKVKNIRFVQRDLMKSAEREVCDSLSCLHVIEHFGLGRYGDEIDPWGYKLGFKHVSDLLKPGGVFYFSVPMGPQRVEFNAHRVFELRYLLNMIGEHGFDIAEFSFVNDDGSLIENAPLVEEAIKSNCSVNLGCALFDLRKRG
jgi:SAM-dependent methyltransferase